MLAIVAYFIWPYTPGLSSVADIFADLQSDRLGGLISLDLLMAFLMPVSIPLTLAMYVALFIGLNVLIYAYGFMTLFLSLRGVALAAPLTWFWAVAMLLNGLGHVGVVVVKREYFPGGLTAPALALVAGCLIVLLMK